MPSDTPDGESISSRSAWDDRQRLARECADIRDQRDDLLRKIADLEYHVEILDEDRTRLCERLLTFGVDDTAEQAKSWGGSEPRRPSRSRTARPQASRAERHAANAGLVWPLPSLD